MPGPHPCCDGDEGEIDDHRPARADAGDEIQCSRRRKHWKIAAAGAAEDYFGRSRGARTFQFHAGVFAGGELVATCRSGDDAGRRSRRLARLATGVSGCKKQILRHQRPGDFAVLAEGMPHTAELAEQTPATVVLFSVNDPPFELTVPGAHNQFNCQAAWAAARVMGVDFASAAESGLGFRGAAPPLAARSRSRRRAVVQ